MTLAPVFMRRGSVLEPLKLECGLLETTIDLLW